MCPCTTIYVGMRMYKFTHSIYMSINNTMRIPIMTRRVKKIIMLGISIIIYLILDTFARLAMLINFVLF